MTDLDLTPTVFIVMPYGKKRDPHGARLIDFDDVWQRVFVPAARRADLKPLRADEEHLGGFIHLAMFEQLLLAEIVLADLTLASPNVMYELGIRHATRPKATISVFADRGSIPFDLSPIRAIPYHLDRDGVLVESTVEPLVAELAARMRTALSESAADSPLFQLIHEYPGVTLPHDATESFQRRVQSLVQLSEAIRSAPREGGRDEALERLRTISTELLEMPSMPTDLLIDLMLAYRDLEAPDDTITLIAQLPNEVRRHPTIRQQLAFAHNRRAASNDDVVAIEILEGLLREFRKDDPETLGLLGRVYKDRHERLREREPGQAQEALRDAIDAYTRGFEADIRDYYPGVNAMTLLIVEGSKKSYKKARKLSPVVAFAVACRRGLSSSDYWDVATVLEVAAFNLDRPTATAAVRRLQYLGGPAWRFTTTAQNLDRLVRAHQERGELVDWLVPLVDSVRAPRAVH